MNDLDYILDELPQGWRDATIGGVCEVISGQHIKTDNYNEEGRGMPYLTGPNDFEDYHPTISKWAPDPKAIAEENDVLITVKGAGVGKVNVLKGERAAISRQLMALRASDVLYPKYLSYYLQLNFPYFQKLGEGSTVPGINRTNIKETPLPLPSIGLQERIVAKIEELFSKLDSGVSELEETEQRLELYSRAVLKAAMEGEFTTETRDSLSEAGDSYLEDILEYRREKWDDKFQEVFKYSGKDYEEPDNANPLDNIDIPNKWAWGTINQISYVVGGLTKNSSKREEYSTEVPYLRVANVYANELDLEEIKTINIREREENTKMLEGGDLLIVEGNGSKSQIGRVALWDGSVSPCSHQNHLIKVRILEEDLRKFVLYWLLSPVGRSTIVDVASSTSGLHTLSISKVRSIPVPIPPAEEAKQIVQAIERRTTVADQVRNDVKSEVSRSDRLRQSILKHAFEDNLVSQEPTEEPPTLDSGDTNLEQGAQATLSEVTSDVE